ncbi:hypothetical protein Gorai_020849 [Gossypium raimondii]|uniref:Malectin-like domain-containing protein n=1 Tax=Gossypium raimondii TaxID=29730 RepID=A0A7J8NP47_GOSRA|nr:hypothetical protein [Gossypium raimondii]
MVPCFEIEKLSVTLSPSPNSLAFVNGALGIVPSRFNVTINYTKETLAYTTPVVVYTTSRTMGLEPNINMNYNLTWNFYIDGGFNYLLRLHFYETQLQVT